MTRDRKRVEGQWALGERQPLNANEQFKQAEDPLLVRERIERTYAKEGFASIPADDLRGRFRWWGLYTQRRPGIDGGRTATLAPEELDDEYFMLRVRVDGGGLDVAQLREVAALSREFARDTADITDRQNIQFHWIRIEDVPEIWRRLEAVGLSTTEACGDCPRVVLGSPVAGVSADEVLDAGPAIREITERYIGDPSLSNLPRKFKSSVSWLPDVPYQIHDVSFLGVEHPEHGPGFDLWVGGGLSTNPRLADRAGAWVPLSEVAEVWAGVAGLFRDYGYRRLRNRARLKFLVADWGVERFREVLEKEYLGRRLADGPAPVLPASPVDHIGVHKQRDGRYYVGAAPVVGRVSGTRLAALADAAAAHGSDRVRLTPYQKVLVLDVADPEPLVRELEALDLRVDASPWRRATMACTGLEYCKLAIVETKARAAELVAELERRLGDQQADITVNLNGCPNACARTQVADIGLKGQLLTGPDGSQVEGFQVHLGGALSLSQEDEAAFGRKPRGVKVLAAELPDFVEGLVRKYRAGRADPSETFTQWVTRIDESQLT
ncbi:nitrite/sulfite reductase [Streptomyces calvus]|uniref:assimilatory sulfite reductase (ferredoxin) n=1 Tax=Streptomyces calvus TaxID=67282 RepID=A0AA40SKJ9_9ACTN|nr:nitrite/sulfite reductase [Streptomyces calvus]MBA8948222.1 sulfite reductase (ferredoxin) [Streptomyces calvus]GGP85115.1 ferredoxin--nitrite reductase [Streptomyces calvus]